MSYSRRCIRSKTDGNNDEEMRYIGLTNGTFKQRYANHCRDFKYRKYEKSTKSSKYIWKLKNEGKSLMIEWSILKNIDSKPRINYCKLCLTEKLFIINNLSDPNLLNNKSELVGKCRHQDMHLVKYCKISTSNGYA